MPADMKEMIVQATKDLVIHQNVRKLTVTDIVNACGITRQTFYYHFEDIPAMFRWSLEKETAKLLACAQTWDEDMELLLRQFFLMAANAAPYIRKGINSNYGQELEHLLTQYVYHFFEQIIEKDDLYPDCTRLEIKLILRYHSQAILGLLREWTDADTENLDRIVRLVYRLITEGIPPKA